MSKKEITNKNGMKYQKLSVKKSDIGIVIKTAVVELVLFYKV